MPILSKPAHARRYVGSDTPQRLADIRLLLDSIGRMDIAKPLKKRMLVHGIWEVAKATGDFCGRFRSEQVIHTVGSRIQRDHIYKKSTLIDELLSSSPDLDKIIERAECCIVTADEHKKLHDIDGGLDGWTDTEQPTLLLMICWTRHEWPNTHWSQPGLRWSVRFRSSRFVVPVDQFLIVRHHHA